MKTTTTKATLAILAVLLVSAVATKAIAEERKTTLADDEAKARGEPAGAKVDAAKPKPDAGKTLIDAKKPPADDGDDDVEPPKPKAKRPRKVARPIPPPAPPYDDDDDAYDRDDCGHHCFGWFHRKVSKPDPNAHKHDGLFLRITGGPGFGSWQGTGTATAPSTVGPITNPQGDGARGGGAISLGGAVGDNLILHADMWFNGSNPRQTRTSMQEFGAAVAGGGLTYYFMPHNVYVSGGVGLATSWLMVLDPNDLDRDWGHQSRHDRIPDGFNYGTGIGTYVMVGKEWWVSDNWGLGIALQGDFARTQGRDLDINYSGVKVLFTATFN